MKERKAHYYWKDVPSYKFLGKQQQQQQTWAAIEWVNIFSETNKNTEIELIERQAKNTGISYFRKYRFLESKLFIPLFLVYNLIDNAEPSSTANLLYTATTFTLQNKPSI